MSEERLKVLLQNAIDLIYVESNFNNVNDFYRFLQTELGLTLKELIELEEVDIDDLDN